MVNSISHSSNRLFIEVSRGVIKDLIPLVRASAGQQPSSIVTKMDGSLVTEVDQQVEELLVARFKRDLPGIPVLGEEGAIDLKATDASEAYSWFLNSADQIIIDPIDGTRNFINGVKQYSIAVALCRRCDDGGIWPSVGVVAVPEEDKLYWSDEDGVFVEDLISGSVSRIENLNQAKSDITVNSRDRAWLDSRGAKILTPWVSSGSSVCDFLSTVLREHKASIIGSQRLWDLMAPLALALRSGFVLKDLLSGDEVRSITIKDLSDDIQMRPWGLARKMFLALPEVDVGEFLG